MRPDSKQPPQRGAERPQQTPAAQDQRDGREDVGTREENRDRLKVNEEHRTPEMEKGHRGSFP